jgi:selenocysteine-specific translation elongation factor
MFGKIGVFATGVKDGVAVMLNASGSALVAMYDKSASRVNQARSAVVPSEKNKLEHAIREYITKVHCLQYEIGVASTRNLAADSADDLSLRANIARLRDCENKIADMKKRLSEIEEEKKAAKAARKTGKTTSTHATTAVVQPLVATPDVAETEAVSDVAADSQAVEEPVLSEKNDTVRMLTPRARKDGSSDVADSSSIESLAA